MNSSESPNSSPIVWIAAIAAVLLAVALAVSASQGKAEIPRCGREHRGGRSVSTKAQFMLDNVLRLYESESHADALDILHAHIDYWQGCGWYAGINDLMAEVDVSRTPPTILLTILTATLATRDRYARREKFYQDVLSRCGEKCCEGLRGEAVEAGP